MWAPMGKLVPQLPGVVTFAYDLFFRRVIACWKGLLENYTLRNQTLTLFPFLLWQAKKHCLGLQNSPRSTTRCADTKTYKISQLD
jgi:hypothetical protein